MKQTELEELVKEFTSDENVLDYSGMNEKINKVHINDIIASNKPDMGKLEADIQDKLFKELGFESIDELKKSVDGTELNKLQTKYDKLQLDFDESNTSINASKRETLLSNVSDEFKEFVTFKIDGLVNDEVNDEMALKTLQEDEAYSKYFEPKPKIKDTGKAVVKPVDLGVKDNYQAAINKRFNK